MRCGNDIEPGSSLKLKSNPPDEEDQTGLTVNTHCRQNLLRLTRTFRHLIHPPLRQPTTAVSQVYSGNSTTSIFSFQRPLGGAPPQQPLHPCFTPHMEGHNVAKGPYCVLFFHDLLVRWPCAFSQFPYDQLQSSLGLDHPWSGMVGI